jgi:hypothetical protein
MPVNPGAPDYKPRRHHLDRFAQSIVQDFASGDPDDLFDPDFVALKLRVSKAWLELARARGYGPRFIRLGPRMPRYRRADLLSYLQARSTVPEFPEVPKKAKQKRKAVRG